MVKSPITALIMQVYKQLTGDADLKTMLGTSWMVTLYPTDPAIEAQGVYDQVPPGTARPLIILDRCAYEDEHMTGKNQLYHMDLRIIVDDARPNSLYSTDVSHEVERILEDSDFDCDGYYINDKHIHASLERADWNRFYVEIHMYATLQEIGK